MPNYTVSVSWGDVDAENPADAVQQMMDEISAEPEAFYYVVTTEGGQEINIDPENPDQMRSDYGAGVV